MIWNQRLGRKLKAKFLWGDWSTGIALLFVPELKGDYPAPDFSTLKNAANALSGVPSDDGVVVTGFPWKTEETQLRDERGRVRNWKCPRRFLLKTSNLIEIEGAVGEYGMSGGPVYRRTGEWLGILSHRKSLTAEGFKRLALRNFGFRRFRAGRSLLQREITIPQFSARFMGGFTGC